MEFLDGVSRWSFSMEFLDGVSRWIFAMEFLDGVYRWSLSMEFLDALSKSDFMSLNINLYLQIRIVNIFVASLTTSDCT